MTKSELYQCSILNLLDIYVLDKEFESKHLLFFIGGPRWLDMRLFTPGIHARFVIISEKLEVLSELVNPSTRVGHDHDLCNPLDSCSVFMRSDALVHI